MTDLEKKEEYAKTKVRDVEFLEEKLKLATRERNKCVKEYLFARDGLKIGDKVTDGKDTYLVCDIDTNGIFGIKDLRTATYWLVGKKIKKDGTPYKNTCNVYRGWEKVEK